jgi:hypothetical protein
MSTNHFDRIATAALLVWLSLAVVTSASAQEDAARYLPAGATLERVPQGGANNGLRMIPVAAIGSIVSHGGRDLAFVYDQAGSLILRVVSGVPGAAHPMDALLHGSFVAASSSLPIGMLVRDVVGRGTQQVLVAASEGASVGFYVDIFAAERDHLTGLMRGGPIGAWQFDLDCAGGTPCKIVSYGKWTDLLNSTVDVFEWDGSQFGRTDKSTDDYFLPRLSGLAASASKAEPMQVYARATIAGHVVALYLARRDYDSGIRVCQAALSRLEDATMTVPRGAQTKIPDRASAFKADLREEKARMHQLLAGCLEAAGRTAEAEAERSLGQKLRTGRQ